MENITENKAKFFAQYLGSTQYFIDSYNYDLRLVGIGTLSGDRNSLIKSILLLKPLSSITDEDAIGLGIVIFGKYKGGCDIREEFAVLFVDSGPHNELEPLPNTIEYYLWFNDGKITPESGQEYYALITLNAYDYLRSKGYALPYMGLSVEELIEYGWVELKNK